MTIGYLFFATTIISFIWHLKSVQITENGIQINRTILPNIIIDKDDIIEIEENRFKYCGTNNTPILYNGYYLTIITKNKKHKTSSLNEPNYGELRETLEETFGQIVTLDKDYKGDTIDWLSVIMMLIPAGYLFVEIIKRIK